MNTLFRPIQHQTPGHIYHLNPMLFFLFHEGAFCLWNYDAHDQFHLDPETILLLMDIAQGKEIPEGTANLTDLIDNDVVRLTPYPKLTWGWDQLSHIFHKGTQNIPELKEVRSKEESIQDFISFSQNYAERMETRPTKEEGGISLSDVQESSHQVALINTLKSRMTARYFTGAPLPESDLSALLYYTFGEIHASFEGVDIQSLQMLGVRKSSPSAGGIHSITAYITIFEVNGIQRGLYRYDAKSHQIFPIHNQVQEQELITIMGDQFFMAGLGFGVFLVSNLEKVWAKYLHSRAYREIFLDAGHLSQTLQLLATSLSLNTWLSGYFRDGKLLDFLHLDGTVHAPLLFVGVGHGERRALHPDIITALEAQE